MGSPHRLGRVAVRVAAVVNSLLAVPGSAGVYYMASTVGDFAAPAGAPGELVAWGLGPYVVGVVLLVGYWRCGDRGVSGCPWGFWAVSLAYNGVGGALWVPVVWPFLRGWSWTSVAAASWSGWVVFMAGLSGVGVWHGLRPAASGPPPPPTLSAGGAGGRAGPPCDLAGPPAPRP